MSSHLSLRLAGYGLALAVVACSGDLTLPNDAASIQLEAVSGDGQQGTVGKLLPDPLVVRLTDAAAQPVAHMPLIFRFQGDASQGEIDPAAIETDSTGSASVRVKLGTTPGPQTIEARVDQDAASQVSVTFGLTAVKKHGGGGGGDNE